MRRIQDIDVRNKVVLLRIDLNLPKKGNQITDTTRIIRSLPTIKHLINHNAKVVILSHFRRPKGVFQRELSLAPIANELQKHIQKDIHFSYDCIGDSVIQKIKKMQFGDILLLENLRFYSGEESNDDEFINQLALLGDVYVNDTFSCSHRKHASIYGLALKLPSASGFLLQDEVNHIEKLLSNPLAPFSVIIGGAKASTKIDLLINLAEKADNLIICGSVANTFLKVLGHNIGKSDFEEDFITNVKEIIRISDKKGNLFLPIDFVTSTADNSSNCYVRDLNNIGTNEVICDIGPKSVNDIIAILQGTKTLVWNGPLGAFEINQFSTGTFSIARFIAYQTCSNDMISVIGGGDTVPAFKNSGMQNCITYMSTGGGAFLEWLEGKQLPGIVVLK